jgi:hypothetical protein
MVRIRRFGVIRTATAVAAIYFILVAIIAIPFAIIVSTTPMTYTDQFGRTFRFELSPLLALFLPFIYAGIGWVFTALACLIYNLAARFTGGIEFEALAVGTPPADTA